MKYAIVFITTRMMNNLYQKPYILIICISIYLYDFFWLMEVKIYTRLNMFSSVIVMSA